LVGKERNRKKPVFCCVLQQQNERDHRSQGCFGFLARRELHQVLSFFSISLLFFDDTLAISIAIDGCASFYAGFGYYRIFILFYSCHCAIDILYYANNRLTFFYFD
jgi:hypothetical protein